MNVFLDFEKPIADLEGKIRELRQLGAKEAKDSPRPAAVISTTRLRGCKPEPCS
jgi:hypothetical protein